MNANRRLRLLLFGFFFFGFLVVYRLFYWQILTGAELSAAAERQHLVDSEIPAQRGRILASDGFPLATNRESYLVYASLPDLKEPVAAVASALAAKLATPGAALSTEISLKEKLNRFDLVWVPLQHRLSREEKKAVEDLGFTGLGFEDETQRFYPEASSAAHLLGFVGQDEFGSPKGYFGLEGYYDKQLCGQAGRVSQEKDAVGRPILVGGFGKQLSADGRDLVLFLDRTVQYFVEEKLKAGIERTGARAGSAVVIEVETGGILALSSLPGYDPADYAAFDQAVFKNPVVADLFEPGSIMKPLVVAAAINEGVVKPKTKCEICTGPRKIGQHTISTFDNQYHPDSTVVEVLVNSDNIGMTWVGDKLGKEKLLAYFNDYGFGQKTEIDLEEETSGSLRPAKEWREIDLATATFGQGIALTRMQIVNAFAALANGGQLVEPRAVKMILDGEREIETEKTVIRRVIKPETAKVIAEMMVTVCEKSPLRFPRGRIPELNGYRIAAKSGTAQIPVAGKYDPTKTIGSVIGFAPADEPRFVVMVNLVEPEVRPWGSDTAGPIFFEILKELLLYYGVQP